MIIGISGKIGSGKDTAAQIIKDCDPESKWVVKKFANKLKLIAQILTGIPMIKFEDQEFKNTYLSSEWDKPKDTGHTILVNGEAAHEVITEPMTVRRFLQELGTDAIRNGLHHNTWVNAMMSDYKKSKNVDEEYTYPNWLVTDVRFPNEADAIREKGGIILRIERKQESKSTHPSEVALDNYPFDYTIVNDGSLEDFETEIKRFLYRKHLNLI